MLFRSVGNTINVVNVSAKTAAHIGYLDLAWVERRRFLGCPIPFTRKVVADDSIMEPGDPDMFSIPPQTAHSLWFGEENHFGWGKDMTSDIYLRLYVIGKNKPVWLRVTGPSDF